MFQTYSDSGGGNVQTFLTCFPLFSRLSRSWSKWCLLLSFFAAQMIVSLAWVKYRHDRLGGGLGLTQTISLRSLNHSCYMANPMEWMTWGCPKPRLYIRLQHLLAAFEPFAVEAVVFLWPFASVPLSLVHRDHSAGAAGYVAVAQKVGWVGEYHVKYSVRVSPSNAVKQGQAVSVVDPDSAGRVTPREHKRQPQFGLTPADPGCFSRDKRFYPFR